MAGRSHRITQLNIGRILAPLTDPIRADFVANLEPINALADGSPGFVWRFQREAGDATAVRRYADDRILINFPVWEDAASLQAFLYQSEHAAVMQRWREWFERLTDVYLVLWWVPAGHVPSIEEAITRLEHLKQHGPSPEAFTFRELYPMPDAPSVGSARGIDDACPAWT